MASKLGLPLASVLVTPESEYPHDASSSVETILASVVRPPSVSLVVSIPSLFFLSQFTFWGSKGTVTDADSR